MKQLLLAVLFAFSLTAHGEETVQVETEAFEGLSVPIQLAEELEVDQTLTGIASWYGPGFHGRRAADGSRYNQNLLTAASNALPLGAWVRVRHLESGLEVVLKITDRMAVNNPRVIDLSVAAARALKMLQQGIAEVAIYVLRPDDQILTNARR